VQAVVVINEDIVFGGVEKVWAGTHGNIVNTSLHGPGDAGPVQFPVAMGPGDDGIRMAEKVGRQFAYSTENRDLVALGTRTASNRVQYLSRPPPVKSSTKVESAAICTAGFAKLVWSTSRRLPR